ncbi:MAG: HD domain-containing protein [Candidatus Paceibacterota bacterium]|jgi:(p)ppGpp synthase/HD superfamily hydrolase|nr:HD domain-containing protein [Candidatus Paceibacterota bacterium]
MNIKPLKDDLLIEKAIIMAAECFKDKRSNKKPALLHSIRVGFKLRDYGQPGEVVAAGILHDLIEDTNCTIEEIRDKFGSKVAKLVSLCTCEDSSGDTDERWHKFIDKVVKGGKTAMIIRVVDANDNLPYIFLIKDEKYAERILWKHEIQISKIKRKISNLQIFKDYSKNYRRTAKEVRAKYKKGG